MKHFKRLISVILALLMIVSGAPLTALADEPQTDISGTYYYDGLEEYALNWSYTASKDKLYLDGLYVSSIDVDEQGTFHLPLFYTDENGNEVLWKGTYTNITFSKNVKYLMSECIGFDYVDGNVAHNVSFESGSQLEVIDDYAFYGQNIRRMWIPDTVYYIGYNAFASCDIFSLAMPEYTGDEEFVVDIAAFAYSKFDVFSFDNCPIKYIPTFAFMETEFEAFSLPKGLEAIGGSAFKDAKFTCDLDIPSTVTRIESNAFEGVQGNCYIDLLSSKNEELELGSYVFENCKLNRIDFRRCNFKSIPNSTFQHAEINEVFLNDFVTEIGQNAFKNATINSTLNLPDSLRIIGDSAFENANLKNIVFSDSITKIQKNAFKSCTVEEECTYKYYINEVEFIPSAEEVFSGSNIALRAFQPGETEYDTILDLKHHNVSGSYREKLNEYSPTDIDWSYNADTDTLYIDTPHNANGGVVKSINVVRYDHDSGEEIINVNALPLFYTDENGNEIFWHGTYHNVVFSNNVTDLGENCLGVDDWEKIDFINVAFEENSSLEVIGNYAFKDAKVIRLELPDTVNCFGKGAFQNSSLQYIKMPHYTDTEDKPVIFNSYVFSGCKELEIDWNGIAIDELGAHMFDSTVLNSRFTIPDYIETINEYAFYNATIVNDLIIPDSVKHICEDAFYTMSADKIIIGKGVKKIDDYAFCGTKVTEGIIELSEKISDLEIGFHAFAAATIKEFNITKSIKSLGEGTFYNCRTLKTITAEDDCIIKEIPSRFVYNCTNLNRVEIPNSVESLGTYAFCRCSALKTVDFQDNSKVNLIDSYSFYEALNLLSITIPSSVINIKPCAFRDCTRLSTVEFEENSQLETISNQVFYKTSIETINIPDSVKTIGYSAFEETKLESIHLPESLKKISNNLFFGLKTLKNINIPQGVTYVGNSAFRGCVNAEIILPNGITSVEAQAFRNCNKICNIPSELTSVGEYAFCNTGITRIEFSDDNKTLQLGNYAFANCENLEYVSFENCILQQQVGEGIFKLCENLRTFIFPERMPEIPAWFLASTSLSGELVLPADTTDISDYAFSDTKITSVDISNKIETIGAWAFADCSLLSEVNFENSRHNTQFSNGSFENCTSLESIVLPRLMINVPGSCFEGSGLTSITLPETVETIGSEAFKNTKITSLNLPIAVGTIETYAFEGCTLLRSFVMPDGSKLKSIKKYAFASCSRLSELKLKNGIEDIGDYAFQDCKINRVFIPASCLAIRTLAFENNPLRIAVIAGTNTAIQNKALFYNSVTKKFDNTGKLYGYTGYDAQAYSRTNNIIFCPLDDIDDVEEYFNNQNGFYYNFGSWENGSWYVSESDSSTLYIDGFGEMESLELITESGETKTFIGIANEFNIETVCIGEGITSIPDYFMYGVGISFVQLPNTLESIGDYAFAGTSIIKVYNQARQKEIAQNNFNSYIPSGVSHIGKYAFAYTDSFNYEIILPQELTEISEGLFYNSATYHVEMYGKVKKFGKKAFANCYNLTTLYVPLSVTDIYTDGNVNNNAFGYNGGELNTSLWVSGRNNSSAKTYCNENGINFSEIRGLPYREGYFKNTKTGHQLKWKYYAEDNSLYAIGSSGSTSNTNSLYSYYENNTDTNKSVYIKDIQSADDVDIKPDKVVIENTDYFYFPYLLSYLNPKKIEIGSEFKKAGIYSFANCTKVEELYFPNVMDFAGSYCFENCTSLKKVRLGYTIMNLSTGLFSECRSLESVDLGNVILQSIGEKAFYNCSSLKFVNLKNQTSFTNGSIGAQAFYNCVNLQEINIPDNIRYIEPKAFYNCVQVQKLTLSGNVTRIEKDAFANLFYCEEININSEVNPAAFSNEKDIFKNLGAYTNGIELNVGSDVNSLNCEFFKDLKITKINLGSGVSALSNKQYLSKLKEITADENETFSVKNGLLYCGSTLVLAPQALTQVNVDSETKIIDDYAFCGTNAKSVTLPDSVVSIGEGCFENSKALVGITLSEGLTAISKNAFKDCTKLRLLNLPENVVIINEGAFDGCTSLVSAVFNNSLSIIGKNAFKDCTRLEGLAFPENLSSIAEGAFMNCAGLKYAYIWNAQIGENAFAFCDKLNIFTPVGTDAYRYAREFDIPYSAYTDEELFFDEWAIKIDALAGYLGYCEEDGHGDIEYLTVYEADCEHDGYVIGVCEYCSEILEEIHINAYGHNYSAETEIPATATTRGISVYTCENCNQSYTTYSAPLDDNFETETHSVSGKIALSADKTAATGLAPAKGASIVIDGMTVATSDENGDFSFEIETGTYEAQIRYSYGFTRTIYIQMRNHDLSLDNPIVIIGCDFSKDGRIDDEDIKLFSMIISAKKNDPSYLRFVDMNGDGYINAKDMHYIDACKGISSQSFRYPLFIIS